MASNDGPKIIGLLLVMKALDLQVSMLTVAGAMAIGGWLSAHKVAVTMSKKISRMSDGQALTANLVTAFMVIFREPFRSARVDDARFCRLDYRRWHRQRLCRQSRHQ